MTKKKRKHKNSTKRCRATRRGRPTLPAVVADAQLLPGEVAVAAVGAAAVVAAVRDVAGLALPVLVALAVHTAGDGVPRGALAVARAVVGARVDAGQRGGGGGGETHTVSLLGLLWIRVCFLCLPIC